MSVEFTINGEPYSVNCANLPADITLNTFIRENAKLFGTKFFCREGGCGSCTVTVRSTHPVTKKVVSRGVNSCLALLNTCHGFDIITIEGLGDRHKGYHALQQRLAEKNGTQCGYCSPAMVMSMYSLLESKGGQVSAEEIENNFGGNLCRCTGYRPILDAMKSFATVAADSESECEFLEKDIEDLKICPKVGKICDQKCRKGKISVAADQRIWYHPSTLAELLNTLQSINGTYYMLVAGNTAHGVYRRDPDIQAFIDVNDVHELRAYSIGNVIELGANTTLTELMAIMKEASTVAGFEYLTETIKHLDLVASVQIRNLGTVAGNLMIKYQHNEFISDIFIILLTIGARMVVSNYSGVTNEVSLLEFLQLDMRHQVIVKIILPKWDKHTTIYGAYKILPRAQHSHAFVNAGFLFTVSANNRITSSRICYNGINPFFNQSAATRDFFNNRNLFDPATMQQAIEILDAELNPDWVSPAPSPEYRKKLALGLFYKFLLRFAPAEQVTKKFRTGGELLERPLSSGTQWFDTRKDRWPLNKPVQKLEAQWQTAGEAKYSNDLPYMKDEVWAAFVHGTVVRARVSRIDPSEALAMEGVVAFYSAKDIPGTNTFVAVGAFAIFENEELFADDTIKYHSQPVGMILAKTNELAELAASRVKVWYEHVRNGEVLNPTVKEAIQQKNKLNDDSAEEDGFEKIEFEECASAELPFKKTTTIQGHLELGGQSHFSIEPNTTIAIPQEGGLLLYSATQSIYLLQMSITNALNIPQNKIDIIVPRVGGSFGGKFSRGNHVGVAAALGAWMSNRPVRFVQNIDSYMRITGKRFACVSDYTVSANEKGKIDSLDVTFFVDMGHVTNEGPTQFVTIPSFPNVYAKTDKWRVTGTDILTDAPSHTFCRAPGNVEAIAMMETMIEHIARAVKKDPIDVRLANIPENSEIRPLITSFLKTTEYRKRRKEIDAYNKMNRWRKRGINITPMNFPCKYYLAISGAVAIHHFDGTVAISHGGIEMGQGLNTKVAQVAAYTLGVPLELVSVKWSNSFIGANSFTTGGSIGSETVGYAVRKACQEILKRMQPIRDQNPNDTWVELVRKAYAASINLISIKTWKPGDLEEYPIWGLACSEIEVDILTGKSQLIRVDILEDTGESLSPLVDIGQAEGAFIMGLGYWFTERLIYDRQTGELTTHNTWEYKVPGAKDIPIDFRVEFYQQRPNPKGFLRSKATGEISICMSISALFALRHALDSARSDVGLDKWYHLGAPTTIEDVVLAAGHSKADFKF